jgi:DNA polymerase III subunit beta
VKLVCLQENLGKGLQVVGRAVAQRSPLPITSNILLESDAGRLKLAATNLEIAITTWIDATVEQEGKVTLPARLLTEFVNALPDESVTLEIKRGQTCHIHAGRFEADIRGMDAEDFPRIPSGDEQPTAHIEAKLLKEMIEQVAFAAAADDTRPVLTGVHCVFSDGELTMAAADSFRMAIRSGHLEVAGDAAFSVIIPARTLVELSKILPDGEEKVALTVTPNRSQIVFQTPDLHVVSRLIEGAFPNVRQLIPTKFQTSVELSTAEFLKATRVASFFSRDNSNMITLDVTPPSGSNGDAASVVVTGSAAEVGENHGQLDAHVEGDEIHVAFNSRYVADALAAIQSPQVGLGLTGPGSAAVIKPTDSEQYTLVVMPIQTSH